MGEELDTDRVDPGTGPERTDSEMHDFEFGSGGVPWWLLLYYLAFLAFFAWYTTEYQLADLERQGPFPMQTAGDGAEGER